jgi:hypothetical protein
VFSYLPCFVTSLFPIERELGKLPISYGTGAGEVFPIEWELGNQDSNTNSWSTYFFYFPISYRSGAGEVTYFLWSGSWGSISYRAGAGEAGFKYEFLVNIFTIQLTLANFLSINLVFVFRCSSSTTNPVSERRVDSSVLVFSLSLQRYSYIHLICSSHFIDS